MVAQSRPTLLLTRPAAASERFARALRERLGDRVEIVISPLMSTRFLSPPLAVSLLRDSEPGKRAAGVIFTSSAGVEGLCRLVAPEGLPAYCVGAQTAAAAQAAGFAAASQAGDADRLVAWLCAQRPPGPLVHARGLNAVGAVAERLTAAGLPTTEVIVYEQISKNLSPEAKVILAGTGHVIVPLFSPRSAQLFAGAAQGATADLWLVAISEAVRDAARKCPSRRVQVASAPTAAAMVEAVSQLLQA